MDIISEIIAQKRVRLHRAKQEYPLSRVRKEAIAVRKKARPHVFLNALSNGSAVNVIAEIKRRSPSKGHFRSDYDVVTIAQAYERNGAAAISVITEEDSFEGSVDHLRAVRERVKIPLLRKDFIFDDYQIYSSAALGADAVLLIVAALDNDLLGHLLSIAQIELGIDALVEVHSAEELERIRSLRVNLIGINNRDLKTFQVSLETSVRLARILPHDAVTISESGIESGADVRRLRSLGYKGFLIGETFLSADDPGRALSNLLSEAQDAEVREQYQIQCAGV